MLCVLVCLCVSVSLCLCWSMFSVLCVCYLSPPDNISDLLTLVMLGYVASPRRMCCSFDSVLVCPALCPVCCANDAAVSRLFSCEFVWV